MHVRERSFDFSAVRPLSWNNKGTSKLLNSLSLLFPIGEKFFIQAVRQFECHASPELKHDIEIFYKQEARHSREHAKFNKLLQDEGIDVASLERNAFHRLHICSNTPEDALIVTVCLEQLTELMAKSLGMLDSTMLSTELDCPVSAMWKWHMEEELEHAHVARALMYAACPVGRLKYARKFINVLWHLTCQVICNYRAQTGARY